MAKSYDRIFAKLFNTPWMIEESWMATIVEIAKREGDIEAVKTKLSDRVDGAREAYVRDGVAHISISGPIFPKANLFTEISGATSIEGLAKDFQAALDDDGVESIILDIDSPGGAVTGINEMGNIIRDARDVKNITAYVSGTGASAAYWLASAASELVIDATARVGSIGVVVAYPAKGDDDMIEIVSTASPNKRVDPSTDEGKKVVIEELDALANVFISTVARNRNVSEATVLKKFGRGGVLVGQDAVDVGMADRLGSFEKLLTEKSNYGGSIMAMSQSGAVVSADSLKKDQPKVYEAIFEAGAATAVSESEQIIKAKDEKIMALETSLAEANTSVKGLEDRMASIEKNEMIRSAKDISSSAKVITDTKLSASSVPERFHQKVCSMINHEKFVSSEGFDVDAFSASVDTEIKDWESQLSDMSPIQGISSTRRDITPDASSDVDSIVDRMLANAGGVQ
jgi:ClpP class serine protease